MSWSKYAEFLAFAVVLVLIPGPDFAVVTKNTLIGGRRRGRWTALGVSSSNLVQGTAAAFGLSALIVRIEPLFEAVKWAGVCYLAYLGAQAIRSAIPCTRFELLTPSAVHLPRRRPPTRVFLVTTAKSGPGIRTRTTANARNSAYFDHDMLCTLPVLAVSPYRFFRQPYPPD